MAASALFDALKDFGSRPAAGASRNPEPRSGATAAGPDIAAIVRAEVAKAEASLEARLRLEHETALAAERHSHAAEVEAMLRHFGESVGETIAARVGEMEERIGEIAAGSAARMLSSFLSEELQKRSVASLARLVREAAADRDAVRIEVRGPQSLFETLSAALGKHAGGVHFMEAPGFDLVVSVDGNLFETRLGEWSSSLSEILS